MEARNITIVSTQNQNKYVVNTDATTLAELKAALRAQGISYEGMTFYEGLSHTELLTDESILPHDVPYKNSTTNELVFMLTVPNKKIRSGSSLSNARKALYDAIAELGLEDVCISVYAKNFTQCKNSELMSLIEEAEKESNKEGNPNLEKAFDLLVDILENEEVITVSEAKEVRSVLSGEEKPTTPYSDEEIDAMFENIR